MGRHALSLLRPLELQCPRHVPAPAILEHGESEKCLHQHIACEMRGNQLEHLLQGETVLRSEGKNNAVIVGGRLQFKIERAAKPLPHRQAPGPIDSCAEWCVDHKLHTARFIEKTLEEKPLLRGHHAGRGVMGHDILVQLFCTVAE